MHLTIFADTKTYRKTLAKALSVPGVNIRTDQQQAEAQDIAIAIVTQENKADIIQMAENCPCFGLVAKDIVLEENEAACFLALFPLPVRLGRVADAVSGFLRHRQQRERLQPLTLGKYQLNPASNELTCPHRNKPVKLTEKEQDILLYLYEADSKPVSRQDMLDNVWGYVAGVETHTLETHIYRLRRKIEADPAAPRFLVTVDEGYCLNF